MAGAATPALAALIAAGVPHEVVKFGHDPRQHSFGVEAVHALTTAGGIAAGQIYKTLIIAVPDGFAVAILPASSKLSLKAAAAALGVTKASMAEPAAAQRATGYVVGAVSPFGQRAPLPTVVDSGALAWDRVYLQCGPTRMGRRGRARRSDPAHRRGHRGDSGLTGCDRFLSDRGGILEHMFEEVSGRKPSPEAIARLDDLFERRRSVDHSRYRRRCWIGSAQRRGRRSERQPRSWPRSGSCRPPALALLGHPRLAVDTEEAVAAEVAAALRISQALAASRLRYARAMRERLPKVGEVFADRDIDFRMFATIVYRTDLITDPDVLPAVDAQLAVAVPRWPSMTRARLASQIDKVVATADADAVRRRIERIAPARGAVR